MWEVGIRKIIIFSLSSVKIFKNNRKILAEINKNIKRKSLYATVQTSLELHIKN